MSDSAGGLLRDRAGAVALRAWGHRHATRLSLFALVSIACFIAMAGWVQVARGDLDWWRATLSLYLHGPWGLGLRTMYCVLAAAITALGVSLYAAMPVGRRSIAPCLLFVSAAVGLCGVAVGDSWLPELAPLLAPLVHGVSALTAFLCVTVAMLLQSAYLRQDPRWRGRWQWPMVLAWASFVLLWVHVLVRATPRGAGQKLVIALILGWLLLLALDLYRHSRNRVADSA